MSVPATFAATLVDEWVRAGVGHAVVSPGSRSTPLALALAGAERAGLLRLHVRLDERSAGFFGLGVGLATGVPAAVVTTSGTAAVELHPAVVEAHQGRVPLIVCTADRPPELHQVGAPQTVDQAGLYGAAVRWEVSPGVPDQAGRGAWRSLGARLVAEAVAGPGGPGPVHANLAFRDPLTGYPGPLPPGRAAGRPWHQVSTGPGGPAADVVAELAAWQGRRGLVVAGAGAGPPEAVGEMAAALGWPVLADPRSGCRLARPGTVAGADALLRSPPFARAHRPEVVLRLGAPWASKVLAAWLAGSGAEQVVVDPWWSWADPERTAATVVRADPGEVCTALARRLAGGAPAPAPAGREWLQGWAGAEAAAQGAIDHVLAGHPEASEPGVARCLVGAVDPSATLVVASSMPVRDVEWFGPALARPPRVLANRGANGIDGTVSTALGVAAGSGWGAPPRRRLGVPPAPLPAPAGPPPTVALLGDLAFLHDAGALLGATGSGLAATLVVLDNGGGGIFSFLPQAQELEEEDFERLFATPQDVDVAEVAAAYRVAVTEVADMADLAPALARAAASATVSMVRVRTDRRANVELHAHLEAAVTAALSAWARD